MISVHGLENMNFVRVSWAVGSVSVFLNGIQGVSIPYYNWSNTFMSPSKTSCCTCGRSQEESIDTQYSFQKTTKKRNVEKILPEECDYCWNVETPILNPLVIEL